MRSLPIAHIKLKQVFNLTEVIQCWRSGKGHAFMSDIVLTLYYLQFVEL